MRFWLLLTTHKIGAKSAVLQPSTVLSNRAQTKRTSLCAHRCRARALSRPLTDPPIAILSKIGTAGGRRRRRRRDQIAREKERERGSFDVNESRGVGEGQGYVSQKKMLIAVSKVVQLISSSEINQPL